MKLTLFCFVVLFAVCYASRPLPDRTDKKFQTECLSAHNKYRAKHQARPLKENKKILGYAKSRCKLLSQSQGLSGTSDHEGSEAYGETLYWGGGQSIFQCSEAMNKWYREVDHYNYNSPGFGEDTGDFTQLVWKSTTNVGCARCGGKRGQYFETYIVCNYSPRGNYQGQFKQNVLKAKSLVNQNDDQNDDQNNDQDY